MNNIFNSLKETSLRILLNLLINKQITLNRLILLDFVSLYGKDFDVSDYNLNGDGPYNLTEYSTKRTQIMDSIKYLVRNGLVDTEISDKTFLFSLSEKGRLYCNEFKSDYAIDYIDQITIAKTYFSNFSDENIQQFVEYKTISHKFEV